MKKLVVIVLRWLPSIIMMTVIFVISSRAGNELPNLGGWDYMFKKGGHVIGYGMLALTYLYALRGGRHTLAWLLALIYAATDEFHQSFVPGRRASLMDVFVFDASGAALALLVHYFWLKCTRSEHGEVQRVQRGGYG